MLQKLRQWIPIVFVFILFTFALYNQGLFFTPTQTYTLTITLLIALLFVFFQGRGRLRSIPIWLAITIAFAGYTLLTSLWAAAPQSALGGALIMVAGVTVGVFGWLQSERIRGIILHLMVGFGAAVYLLGIGTAVHFWNYNSAVVQNMVNSVFQYHNTFGAFELATFSVGLGLLILSQRWWTRALLMAGTSLSLLGVISSYSRLVWILVPIIIIATIVLAILQRTAMRTTILMILTFVVSMAASPFAITAMVNASAARFGIELLIVVAGSALLGWVSPSVERLTERKSFRYLLIIGVAVVLIGAIVYLVQHEAGKLGSLVKRAGSIDFQDFSVKQRFFWYQEAIREWSRNPIFGSGWGTWTARFQSFEQYPYWSTQSHSILTDVLLNTGLIGFLLWLGGIVLGYIRAVKCVLNNHQQSGLYVAAILGSLPLFLHATFDFDWTFPIVVITFYLLLSLSSSGTTNVEPALERSKPKAAGIRTTGIAILWVSGAALTVLGVMMSVSQAAYQSATKALYFNDQQRLLKTAASWAPWDPTPQIQLVSAEYNWYKQSKDPRLLDDVWTHAQIAHRDAPWDPGVQMQVANIAYAMRKYPQAYAWAKLCYSDGIYHSQYPATYMGIGLWSATLGYASNPTNSMQEFREIVKAYQDSETRLHTATEYAKKGFPEEFQYDINAQMQVYAATADYALGNYQQSIADMQPLSTDGQDQPTLGLSKLVSLLDNQHLHTGKVDFGLLQQVTSDPTLNAEYLYLKQIHPKA